MNRQALLRSRSSTTRPLDVPTWLPVLSLLLAVAGIAVATYLTIAHFDESVTLVCSDNGAVNCGKVTTSKESYFLGMPVAALGLGYFVAAPILLVPAAWRSPSKLIRSARVLSAAGGVAFIAWLIYAEMFRIHAICLYCTAVHALTFLLFVVILLGTAITAPYLDEADDEDLVEA